MGGLEHATAEQFRVRSHGKAGIAWMVVCAVALTMQSAWCLAQPQGNSKANVQKTSPQTALLLSSYEGQNVSSIEIAGQPGLDTSQFTSLFVQRVGTPFSKKEADQTIAAIEKRGKFKKVGLTVEPETHGLRVLYVLEPAVYFGIFDFTGAGWFSYSRLLQVTNYPPEAAYNSAEVQDAVENLLQYCRQEGFFKAQVKPEIQMDPSRKVANVIFHMDLGPHSKFGKVEIAGVTPQLAQKLANDLGGIWPRLKGAAIRPGRPYHYRTITRATRYMQGKLDKQDRLAAHVQLTGADYNPTTNRADIHFDVRLGPVIRIKIKGAHLWSWTRKSLLPMYQGVGINAELVQEGRQALISYFQGKGYFDAAVQPHFQKENSAFVITYDIAKGKRHKVTRVSLAGNHTVSSEQLMPLLKVQKARFLSRGKYSEKLVRSSVKNIEDFYRSEGFSGVAVTPSVVNRGDDIAIAFNIQEGPRDIVQSLHVAGADTMPESKFAPQGLYLKSGGPYSQKLVEQDRKSVIAHYLDAGYPTASFRETAKAASKRDPHHVNVVYQIYEGPRVTIGNILTLGRKHTRPRVIQTDIRDLKPGEPLAERKLLRSESRLYENPGVFDWAEIDPKHPITTQTSEDVLVKVHEAPRNRITYGFGFEMINRGGSVPSGTVALPNLPPIGLPSTFRASQKTFYGPRGTIEYTRNNVRGRGESISLIAFAGRLDQRGAVYYINPNLFWSGWSSTASVSAEHDSENPIFSSYQESGGYQVQTTRDRAKTQTLFVRYNFSHTELTRLEIPELVLPEDRNVRLSAVGAAYIRDTRDNILNAHKGILESFDLNINSTWLGADVNFAKLTAQTAYYKEIGKGIVWANSVRMGLAQPFAGSRVPLSEEFFTGGGSTLRGYPLFSAGPQRKVPVCNDGSTTDCSFIQVPTGGRELMLINSEFRIPLPIKKNLGFVAFYDGGNVFPVVGFHDFTSLYSNNAGLGLRYNTPVGPIRFDVGRNLNPVPGINPTQYFISIGQAF